jgi:disulfide bond formation protein DsbB
VLPRDNHWPLYFVAWLLALISTLGSLFFSEVLSYPPCVLCWYQRICMYPLVLILLVCLFKAEKNSTLYAIPLSFLGAGIALYHNLLYYKLLPESSAPCTKGISCTSVHIEWFGFITIPLLSFIAFSLISTILILIHRGLKNEK